MKDDEKDAVIAHLQKEVKNLSDMLSSARSYVEEQQRMLTCMTTANSQINKQLELVTERLNTTEAVTAATKYRELKQSTNPTQNLRRLSERLSRRNIRTPSRDSSSTHECWNYVLAMRALLIQRLDTAEVAAHMFQNHGLTLGELETIQDCPKTVAVERLLSILKDQPFEVYQCFLNALRHSNQEDIFVALAYQGWFNCLQLKTPKMVLLCQLVF